MAAEMQPDLVRKTMDTAETRNIRRQRAEAEWKWLCRFYKTAIANTIKAEKEEQEERARFLKSLEVNRAKRHSLQRSPVNQTESRPRTWSDGNIQYEPGKKSPIDTFSQHKKIKGPKYVRVIQNGSEEKRYELSPYETPVWPQTVLVVYDESRYEYREIRSEEEIPRNVQRIEIKETEIQQFARKITHPSTLTFKLIYHVLGRAQTGEWFSSQGADESIVLALDRLVRITNNPRYELDFVFEAKFSNPRYYKIVKRPPKSPEEIEKEAEKENCPTDEDLQAVEEEIANQETEQASPTQDEFSPPVLTGEQQKHIEKFARKGLAFDEIFESLMFNHKILTREEETELALRVQGGDLTAKNELIQTNLKLVVNILRRFNIWQNHPIFWDMLAEGVIGLMRVAEKFEPQRGFKFSTYATWWIRQVVLRAITDKYYKGPMRLPVHMVESVYSLRKTVRAFLSKHHREPTIAEIADLMGIPQDNVRKILRAKQLQMESKTTSTLSEKIEEDDRDSVMDIILYQGGAIPDQREVLDRRISEEQNMDFILDTIDHIPSVYKNFGDAGKIRYILIRYFSTTAVGDNPEKTNGSLEDIGIEFGVTRERVRQWIEVTLAALRRYIKPEQLGVFIDKRMINLRDMRLGEFIHK